MHLSIVTLNFRKKELTLSCLASLYATYNKEFEKNEFEVIVVDNFSQDNSADELKQAIKKNDYHNCVLIENEKNAGFGSGSNLGAKPAKGRYILFLNNDTLVHRGLTEMVEYLDKHTNIAILGGMLKNDDGTTQVSSGKFYSLFHSFLFLLGLQRFGLVDRNPSKISQVDWVKGALLLIRKEVFVALGGFDEKIFMYMEDMELCYRARMEGYAIAFYPDVDIRHKDQGSSNRTFAIVNIYKSLLYFYSKHKSKKEYEMLKALLLLKGYIAIMTGLLSGNKKLAERYQKAIQF